MSAFRRNLRSALLGIEEKYPNLFGSQHSGRLIIWQLLFQANDFPGRYHTPTREVPRKKGGHEKARTEVLDVLEPQNGQLRLPVAA
jgi:hypothetical protein